MSASLMGLKRHNAFIRHRISRSRATCRLLHLRLSLVVDGPHQRTDARENAPVQRLQQRLRCKEAESAPAAQADADGTAVLLDDERR